MEKSFTRRQFAIGSVTALGAIAASGLASAAPNSSEGQEAFDPYKVPTGEKQFVYRNIINNDGSTLEERYSPIDGVVHELLVRRVVFQGDQLYNLVQFAD